MKTISVYLYTTTGSTYKALWPKAFYEGLQHHKDWKSTYVSNRELVDTEYCWCFAYQVKGDIKQSDTSLRRRCIEKWEPKGKIFFLDSDVLISYDGFELNKNTIKRMTEQNLRWTRQPYSTIYASKGAKYFEDQFMHKSMDRWDDIAKKKKQRMHHPELAVVRFYQNIIGLQSYLKANKIPYVFYNSLEPNYFKGKVDHKYW